jgi:hypothetical protein
MGRAGCAEPVDRIVRNGSGAGVTGRARACITGAAADVGPAQRAVRVPLPGCDGGSSARQRWCRSAVARSRRNRTRCELRVRTGRPDLRCSSRPTRMAHSDGTPRIVRDGPIPGCGIEQSALGTLDDHRAVSEAKRPEVRWKGKASEEAMEAEVGIEPA